MEMVNESPVTQQICNAIDKMTSSVSSAREVLKSLKENQQALDTKNGISLLNLKNHVLLSYLQSLLLVSSRRALGHSLKLRSPPNQPFSAVDREARGNEAGDLVDAMIENRVVLEKIKVLEGRMRYQIEKLVRVAEEPEKNQDVIDDPLAFRPNPQNLIKNDQIEEENAPRQLEADNDSTEHNGGDGIYHPPRLAPMPYTEKSKSKTRKDRPPVPSALASLSSDPSRPHIESTSGLGAIPSLASGRAAYLKRLAEFEEENFSRVVMKKSDAKRRARDEEDLALGGDLGSTSRRGRRRAGGLEDEFGEVLRSVERGSGRRLGDRIGDGYEELRRKGKKGSILDRSRRGDESRKRPLGEDTEGIGRTKKRSRFELATKVAKKKLSKGRKPM